MQDQQPWLWEPETEEETWWRRFKHESAITIFAGEFRFLSNFSPSPLRMSGAVYPTVEHAYQAAKTLDAGWRERIRLAPDPLTAKRLGRDCPLREGWDAMRVRVMTELVRTKFKDPALRARLLATGERPLIEGEHARDLFWGQMPQWDEKARRMAWVGENHLGHILTLVRKEARVHGET